MKQKVQKKTFEWKIGGPAGYGINKSGLIFSKTCARQGYYVFDYAEFPSIIRGGHTNYQTTLSNQPVRSTPSQADVLVGLDDLTITLHAAETRAGGVLIYDAASTKVDIKKVAKHLSCVDVPLLSLAKEFGHSDLARNSVSIGASLAVLGLTLQGLESVFLDVFGKKGAAIAQANYAAAAAGYEHAKKNCGDQCMLRCPKPPTRNKQIVITGNEAAGMGAIASGCNFYAAYPMSPSTGILHYMAEHGRDFGVVVRQGEDEIAVINMAIGAAFAGARAQVGTSGGGFCLMVEGLGLAGATETPVVVVIASRPGPSTGLPTWTAQADLQFAITASHGEFPRAVIAPGDAEEMFYAESIAHNLAETFQIPVIILEDNILAESHQSFSPFSTDEIEIKRGALLSEAQYKKLSDYKRYKVTASGISPRALPHYKGGKIFSVNSDEHDEYGYSEESAENRIAQDDKRWRKFDGLKKVVPGPRLYGPKKADLTVVAWGSTKGAVLDALDLLPANASVNFYHYQYLWPFPAAATEVIFKAAKKTFIIEGNRTGQLAQLVRQETGLTPSAQFNKYDGRPFWPDEIAKQIMEQL